MVDYMPTIGLEVHAELRTKTKMFCSCQNDPDEKRPNVNICPICMGHPGTLPVINKEAVKSILKVGLAVGGELADFSEFDRKNYFYPDIPKGYQISQYKHPLVSGGHLAGVKLTRIHLEEDTARSTHQSGDYSLIDFNRAGVPLMELVTEPVIKSAEEAAKFGKELQLLLQYLGVALANMEKGEMRLEANVSISKDQNLGTKVEIKNLNSFRAVERAIQYEVDRQAALLDKGGKVVQETRGWNEDKGVTFPQREKEESHDYRYFPEPDLPKLKISEDGDFDIKVLKNMLGETPADKRTRFKENYGIKDSDIDFYISNVDMGALFEEAASIIPNKSDLQLLSNYIVSDVVGLGQKGSVISGQDLATLIAMISAGEISSRGAKEILSKMAENEHDPKVIAEKEGLLQKNDEEELHKLVEAVISENKAVVDDYKNGNIAILQFLIGQTMKASKGAANPQKLKEILEKLLK